MKTPTLKSLIENKKWYYVNSAITDANFPAPTTVQSENWKLINMEKSFSSQEALERIKAEGCRPANIHELALFADLHPEQFPEGNWMSVIAFGSSWTDSGGNHRVPGVFAFDDGDFGFGLGDFEGSWGDEYCLLCFCDQSSDTQALSDDESLDSLTLERAIEICKSAGLEVIKRM